MRLVLSGIAGILLLILSCHAFESNVPIVISGAGPAALVFAHRFLRLNKGDTCIAIYEKREKPVRYVDSKNLCVAGDYAFGFGLSQKAQRVLRKVPGLLEAVEAISQPASFAPGIDLRIINRRELCAELIYELEQEFGSDDRLQLHFGTAVTDLDPNKQQVTVTDYDTNTQKAVPYSLLIGADGANSVVRSKLIEYGDLQCERYYSDVTWKALQIPEQPDLDPSAFQRYPKPFYKPHKFIKRDNGALVPRFQNRFVLLNFRAIQEDDTTETPFDATTPAQLRDAISKALPNVTNFPPESVMQEFIDQKPGRESYMKLDRHSVPSRNVVLIGDAAVGMYSLFGQGCASAMMEADRLAEMLANATDLVSTLESYSNVSVVEGHAISDLNLLTHPLRRSLPIKLWAGFQMMGIGKTLAQKPEVSYSEILKKRKRAIWFSKIFWRKAREPAPTVISPK